MANGNRAISMAVTHTQNQIKELVSKCKKMDTDFMNWLASPPLPVDAAIAAVNSAADAATLCFVRDVIVAGIGSVFPVHPRLKPFLEVNPQSSLKYAIDMAVIVGCDAGIERVMKRIRGKKDVESSMVAGFGAGMLFGLVTGEPDRVVIGFGILTALAKGGMFKVIEKSKSSR